MSGRIVRKLKAREAIDARAALAALAQCDCGAKWEEHSDGVITITSHSPACAYLGSLHQLRDANRCTQCGHRFRMSFSRHSDGYVERKWCLRCHSFSSHQVWE